MTLSIVDETGRLHVGIRRLREAEITAASGPGPPRRESLAERLRGLLQLGIDLLLGTYQSDRDRRRRGIVAVVL